MPSHIEAAFFCCNLQKEFEAVALINCSNCGGQVSDKAETCPHCGYNFKEAQVQQAALHEFTHLPEEKQKALREEYNLITPRFSQAENELKRVRKNFLICSIVLYVTFALAVISLLMYFFLGSSTAIGVAMVVLLILVLGSLIGCYVIRSKAKKPRNEWLKELKKFVLWLKQSKDINYDILISEEERKIYDTIDIK